VAFLPVCDAATRDIPAAPLARFTHLPLHLDHLLAHVQNDFDARQVHAISRASVRISPALEVRIRVQRVFPAERDGFSSPTRS